MTGYTKLRSLALAVGLALGVAAGHAAVAEEPAAASTATADSITTAASTAAEAQPEPTGQTVYKVRDKDGRVHYTTTPAPASKPEAVDVTPANILPSPNAERDGVRLPAEPAAKALQQYSALRMTSPQQDETFGVDIESFPLSAELVPALQPDHAIQFLLDGVPLGSPGRAMSYQLSDPERGTHTASARVTDEKGNILIQGDSVSFHVKRYSRLQDKRADESDVQNPWSQNPAPQQLPGSTGTPGATGIGGTSGVGGAPSMSGAPPKPAKPGK